MADFYLSRMGVTFTPTGGAPQVLLRYDDVLAELPEREWQRNTELTPLVGSSWALARDAGNAALVLRLQVLLAAPGMPALTAILRRAEYELNTEPVGTVLLEEGFAAEGVPTLRTRWAAVVTAAMGTEVTQEEAPPMVTARYGCECRAWGRLELELTLTNPEEL